MREKVLILDCTREQWTTNTCPPGTVSMTELADADIAVTRDRWMVKNREGVIRRVSRLEMLRLRVVA